MWNWYWPTPAAQSAFEKNKKWNWDWTVSGSVILLFKPVGKSRTTIEYSVCVCVCSGCERESNRQTIGGGCNFRASQNGTGSTSKYVQRGGTVLCIVASQEEGCEFESASSFFFLCPCSSHVAHEKVWPVSSLETGETFWCMVFFSSPELYQITIRTCESLTLRSVGWASLTITRKPRTAFDLPTTRFMLRALIMFLKSTNVYFAHLTDFRR